MTQSAKPARKPGQPAQPARVPTGRERLLLGQARRKQLKRQAHAVWNPKDRQQDPLDLLAASNRGRIPSLVALKEERMTASPFAYLRGSVPVMAYDLSLAPNTGLLSQLCGDAHVRNLGAFAGPDGRLVFDINDFDETVLGPFEWDVKRMATSLILAGREAGAGSLRCREAAATFLTQYRDLMHLFSKMPVLEVARYQVHRLAQVGPVAAILNAARRSTPLHSLAALTEPVPTDESNQTEKTETAGKPAKHRPKHPQSRRFKTAEPVLWRLTEHEAQPVIASLVPYAESLLPERRRFLAQYRVLDVAFKVVGTGSVGLRDYCIYLEGNGSKDPLFLQIKEETLSAYAPFVGENALRDYHQGRRTVEGERAMQIQSDPFLGWTTIVDPRTGKPRDFLVRQLNDHKASLDLSSLKSAGLMEYAKVAGEILARGHARSGDFAMLAGYLGTSDRFCDAITRFAETYADQTEKDWEQFVKSLKASGKLPKKGGQGKKTVIKTALTRKVSVTLPSDETERNSSR
ncbi:MAG TPA: DUF2252 domain-containing protein [Granulicella sp.]|nr:DUF2252 domain-containing protein [Granulicella sp.]